MSEAFSLAIEWSNIIHNLLPNISHSKQIQAIAIKAACLNHGLKRSQELYYLYRY